MTDRIPLSSPDITDLEREAVMDVLKTSTLSLGPKLKEFEDGLALVAKRKYAVAVNSGTSALHLIVRTLGIKEGDEVITTPFSFISSSNSILYERAKPIFVDIDKKTLNIDPKKIEEKITERTKAILAIDMFGNPADWDAILAIAEKHNLKVIEDSAEAIGSSFKGKPCGSFGDAAIFAFYPNKQITTGEGGVILTDDREIADMCRSMSNQGREFTEGNWLKHEWLGYNYRISDILCALGVAQLERFDEILKKRSHVFDLYTKKLQDIPGIRLPVAVKDSQVNWFVYVIQLAENYTREQRDAVIKAMQDKEIQCSTYFQSIHLQPFYMREFGYKRGDYPISESVSDRAIALPFFNNLEEKDIDRVKEALIDSLGKV